MVEAKSAKPKDYINPLPGQAIKQHEKLQKVLSDAKSKKHLGNLYEHIQSVINHIVKYCPDQALERFEEISWLLKNKDSVAIAEFLKTSEQFRHCSHEPQRAQATSGMINEHRAFFVSNRPTAHSNYRKNQLTKMRMEKLLPLATSLM